MSHRTRRSWRHRSIDVLPPAGTGVIAEIRLSQYTATLAVGDPALQLDPRSYDENGVLNFPQPALYAFSTDVTKVRVDAKTFLATRVATGGSPTIEFVGTKPPPVLVEGPKYHLFKKLDPNVWAGSFPAAWADGLRCTNDSQAIDYTTDPHDTGPYGGIGAQQMLQLEDGLWSFRLKFDGADNSGGFGQEAHSYSWVNANGTTGRAGKPIVCRQVLRVVKTGGTVFDASGPNFGGIGFVVKGTEYWRASGGDRAQFDFQGTVAGRGSLSTIPTSVGGFYGNAGLSTWTQATQVRGPFLWEWQGAKDVEFIQRYMTQTPNAGTATILMQTATVKFDRNQAAAVGMANGSRILLPGSTAEFVLSNFVAADATNASHSTALATRSGSVLGTLAYSNAPGYPLVQAQTASMTCSTSQAAEPTFVNGELLSIKNIGLPYTISGYNGSTTCSLAIYSHANTSGQGMSTDLVANQYSTIHDGFAEWWINGVLVLRVSKETSDTLVLGDQSNTGQIWHGRPDLAGIFLDEAIGRISFISLVAVGITPFTVDYRLVELWEETLS